MKALAYLLVGTIWGSWFIFFYDPFLWLLITSILFLSAYTDLRSPSTTTP